MAKRGTTLAQHVKSKGSRKTKNVWRLNMKCSTHVQKNEISKNKTTERCFLF